MPIKVVHLNYSDSSGGAAIAVNRIHNAQKMVGIESKILAAEKNLSHDEVIGPASTFEEIKWKIFLSLNRKIGNFEKKKKYDSNSYNIFPNNIVDKINKIDCDIVNLHWIGNNFLPIKSIRKINKPIVWTLHDMWAYTGSEHYTKNLRYIDGYNSMNKPKDIKGYDIEKYCWNLKKKYYPENLKIVTTSEWQTNNVKKSFLLKNKKIIKIPLPIDLNFWKPIDKKISRKMLNLPENKKIILIGSERIDIERKGFYLVKEILNKIDKDRSIAIIFGRNTNKVDAIKGLKIIYFGEVEPNSYDLKILYSAADLFLAPSIQESFGQTVLEGASCNLPSICFKNNGISEIIKHKINGYIAEESNIDDFANGVNWCLNNLKDIQMKENLKYIENKFSFDLIGNLYKKLYESIK